MIRINIIIALIVGAVTYGVWAWVNQPEVEPSWPSVIQGFSFSPMRLHHNPLENKLPTITDVEEDIALLEGKTHAIRTYTVSGTLGAVPELAKKYDINVALGAWIDQRLDQNQKEVDLLISIADKHRSNVVRVVVGNEVILRNDTSIDQLITYLDHARAQLGMPVSTAEPWHVWMKHPKLADHVDYLAVHMLPYWEGIALEASITHIQTAMYKLKKRFPDKPIVIAEVGWPSNGRTIHSAAANEAAQAIFLRRFLNKAEKENYIYYIMEAFDQPWKRANEGSVGAYWGVYNAQRQAKFEFTAPIVGLPQWQTLAILSLILAAIIFALLLTDSNTLNRKGRSFLALIAYLLTTAIVWIAYDYSQQYMTIGGVAIGILMMIGMVGVIIVLLIEAHEWAEALWVKTRRRTLAPITLPDHNLPKVSIHVPAYNEPPQMLKETLNALSRLDYPDFEVIVIDNNTACLKTWKPIEQHCKNLGEKFRFFHQSPLSGFKAGALNFALEQTAKDATIIAVIDSDYCVDPSWLRDLIPQFSNKAVAIVQAPQDYRDAGENLFKAICFTEYRGFFHIGMVTRNERNAIIQHGTMTMVRRTCLEAVGGWGTRTITEDAQLGLMLFAAGHQAVYTSKSYGKGLMPDSFVDYKNQRFRWAYGAMQIMRHHLKLLSGREKSHLSSGQRYHFIAGWLPWMADGINLIFNIAALAWSFAMIAFPNRIDPPLVIFSILPLSLFIFKIAKMFYLYRGVHVVGSAKESVAAAISGLALSHTIAKAMWTGVFTDNRPFLRTPKMEHSTAFMMAMKSAREEAMILAAFWISAVTIYATIPTDTWDTLLWTMVLLVQSLPYFCALLMSAISAMPPIKIKSSG